MAFTNIISGDPGVASVVMANFKHVNYGSALLPVDTNGAGVNNTLDLGSASYRWANIYGVDANLSGDLLVDTDTLSVDATNDKVGVNVASPDEALHVVAADASYQLKLARSNTSAGEVVLGGASGEFYIYVNVQTVAKQALVIATNGDTGIGTASPAAKLHVYDGSSNSNGSFQVGGTNGLHAYYEAIGSGRVAITSLNNAGGSNNIIGFGFGSVSSGLPTNNVFSLDQNGSITLGAASAKIIPGSTSLLFRNNADSATNLTIEDGGDIYTEDDTDYSSSSTVTGWSSFTTKYIKYSVIGRFVFVHYLISGTSNAVTASFTLPYASAESTNFYYYMVPYADDNTNHIYDVRAYINGSSTAVFENAANGSGWTASGTKTVGGTMIYKKT